MTDDKSPRYASSPCASPERLEGTAADDVQAWRRAERARLTALRRAISAAQRQALDAAIATGLDELIRDPHGRCIGVYWPIRGEPELQAWYRRAADAGALLALPVVAARDAPLAFHAWQPGDALEPGVFGVPVPQRIAKAQPDVILTPLVGFDRTRHRLGNGGGYYDRTLAALATPPLTVGVGYECCALQTIYPQAHDIAMDRIVTEAAIRPRPT